MVETAHANQYAVTSSHNEQASNPNGPPRGPLTHAAIDIAENADTQVQVRTFGIQALKRNT
jgi:hypothetical protein